jgi:hypothetical protein
MSVGCGTVGVSLQLCHSQLTLYARNIPNAVCATPLEDEHVEALDSQQIERTVHNVGFIILIY